MTVFCVNPDNQDTDIFKLVVDTEESIVYWNTVYTTRSYKAHSLVEYAARTIYLVKYY